MINNQIFNNIQLHQQTYEIFVFTFSYFLSFINFITIGHTTL